MVNVSLEAQVQERVREIVLLLMKRPITEETAMQVKLTDGFRHLEVKNGEWTGLEKSEEEVGVGEQHGWIETLLIHFLTDYVLKNDAGRIYPGDVTFVLEGTPGKIVHQCEPDVAFVSKANVKPTKGFIYRAPDLAVEIVSPSQSPDELRAKITEYIEYGTKMGWLLIPDTESIEVHRPNTPVLVCKKGDTLSGYDVLPGFSLEIAKLFEE